MIGLAANVLFARRGVCIGLAAFALSCSSQPAPSPAQPPVAPPKAIPPPPGLATHFDMSYRTLLYLTDPLPYLERLLEHPGLVRQLTQGPVTEVPRMKQALDPKQMRRALAENRRWIPIEAAAGMDRAVQATIDGLIKAFLFGGLCASAISGSSDAGEIDTLQKAFIAEIEALDLAGLRVWVRLRDAGEAAQLFNLVRGSLDALPQGGDVQGSDSEIALSLTVDTYLDGDLLGVLLQQLDLVRGPEDPNARAMAEAIGQLRLHFRLVHDGSELVADLGDDASPATRATRAAQLGELLATRPHNMAMWSSWDVRPLKRAAREWTKLLDTWMDTPAGRELAQSDTEDLIGDLRGMARLLDTAADNGELRLDASSPIRVAVREQGVVPAEPLAGSGILPLLPANSTALVSADATRSLADTLLEQMDRFERRLATRWLKAFAASDSAAVSQVDHLTESYYHSFNKARDMIRRDAKAVFTPPSGVVFTTGGRIDRLTVSNKANPADPDLDVRDLPVPQLMFVSKLGEKADGERFARELYSELVRALLASTGRPAQPGLVLVRRADLGLAVATNALHAPWIAKVSGDRFDVEVVGDFRPHYFVKDGFFVLSTSPALSRKIADRSGASRSAPLRLPRAQLTRYGRASGAMMSTFVQQMKTWLEKFDSSDAKLAESLILFDITAGFLGLIDRVEWSSIDRSRGDRASSITIVPAR